MRPSFDDIEELRAEPTTNIWSDVKSSPMFFSEEVSQGVKIPPDVAGAKKAWCSGGERAIMIAMTAPIRVGLSSGERDLKIFCAHGGSSENLWREAAETRPA